MFSVWEGIKQGNRNFLFGFLKFSIMIYAEVQAACTAHQDAAQQRGNDHRMSSLQQGILIRD